jgi:hypothetical protein
MNTDSAYYFFVAWIIILGTGWAMTKAEGTRTILYYLIILAIVLDLVTHAQEIQDILSKAGIVAGTSTNETTLQTTTFTPLR